DLIVRYVCRLLNYMDASGYRVVTPTSPTGPLRPLIDLQAGYIMRSLDKLPKRGTVAPWRIHQNYPRDVYLLRRGPVDDEGVRFSRGPSPVVADRAAVADRA
ncbi:MAG TPA: FAD-containing monooxygenase EthA, partial [Jatrophihabitantaceae bacterium]